MQASLHANPLMPRVERKKRANRVQTDCSEVLKNSVSSVSELSNEVIWLQLAHPRAILLRTACHILSVVVWLF
jgi:hypothetical protein